MSWVVTETEICILITAVTFHKCLMSSLLCINNILWKLYQWNGVNPLNGNLFYMYRYTVINNWAKYNWAKFFFIKLPSNVHWVCCGVLSRKSSGVMVADMFIHRHLKQNITALIYEYGSHATCLGNTTSYISAICRPFIYPTHTSSQELANIQKCLYHFIIA